MTFKRTLATVLGAAAVLPCAASAQAPITPPDGDNYLSPIALSDFDNPGKFPTDEIGFTADTTNYTTQPDMFNPPSSGGPPEPSNCGTPYGNTIWSVFYADRYGVMRVSTAGPFDSVIGFVPFDGPLTDPTPDIGNGVCIDRLSGFEEELSSLVRPKQWYAVQVGGTGASLGGPVQVKFDYQPPPRLTNVDAVLSWSAPASGGVTASKLVVKAPKGAKVSIKCTRRGCKAPRAFTVKKPQAFRKLAPVGPVAKAPAGVTMTPASGHASPTGSAPAAPARARSAALVSAGARVHAAKKYKLLKRKRLKAGSKLIIRVTAPGYIGKYFQYRIKRKKVSSKKIRCLNPGSKKPHKRCADDAA